jgi:hypothetical protein
VGSIWRPTWLEATLPGPRPPPSEVNPTKFWPNSFKAWLKTPEQIRIIISRVLNFLEFNHFCQWAVNSWTQRDFWRSVHGIRERNESSGLRSTESVDATRVLAFGPRNPCITPANNNYLFFWQWYPISDKMYSNAEWNNGVPNVGQQNCTSNYQLVYYNLINI